MKSLLLLFTLIAMAVAITDYSGYKVVRVGPKTFRAKERFDQIKQHLTVLKVLPGAEFSAYDVVVSPDKFTDFQSELNQFNIDFTLQIDNLQELIENQRELNALAKSKIRQRRPGSRIDHTYYRTLDEINQALDDFVVNHPTLMTKTSIGQSYEGRDLNVMKVSSGGDGTREVIWISCGIHAREWISQSSCLFFLDSLSTYGTDSEITALLDTYDFFILTVVNPDGYSFTWSDNRLWRKNRYPSGTCFGVDINRNFDSDFGGPGTSTVPCFDTYDGPFAFSELESQAIRDAVNNENGRIKMFTSLHAYAQLWMYPYGYTRSLTVDDDELNRVASIGVTALESVYGTEYDYGSIARVIYEAAGGSVDWTYDTAGIVYSFAIELRDTGFYGFVLPPTDILPVATETWTGLKAAINALP